MATMKANKREESGTRVARHLRAQGLIPGVIYGHGQPTESITLDEHEVELAVLHGERLLEIDMGGQKQNALITDVQYDTFGQSILHVDLTRVDLDERVEVTVAIELRGTPIGVREEDGMLHQIAPEVNIECPVRSIPDEIEVVVTEMHIGDTITMGDLELPPSAKLLDEPDDPVASVQYISEEEEEEPEEGLEAAEPEIIGEAAAEEGEEGEAEGGEGEQE